MPLLAVVVFHEYVNGALLSVEPRLFPSSWNCTDETLDETVVLIAIVPFTDEPLAGVVIAMLGAGEELAFSTFTLTGWLEATFPPELARAARVWVPLAAPWVFHE